MLSENENELCQPTTTEVGKHDAVLTNFGNFTWRVIGDSSATITTK